MSESGEHVAIMFDMKRPIVVIECCDSSFGSRLVMMIQRPQRLCT
jgi:hypothetical protein